ncbi:hypothetical protein ACJJTC_009589 [Scirpophaga incertulas]
MNNRYDGHIKGSSRSTRDDSRTYKQSSRDEHQWSRSRSRSPYKRSSPARRTKHSPERAGRSSSNCSSEYKCSDKKKSKPSNDWEDSDEEVPAPPPPPRITKISIGFTKPKEPIKMTLGGSTKTTASIAKPSVASVFNNDDDDDEPEEMPAEARMRMRNIGRETPTSAGPNSFGKTKQGFCDAKKVFEKNLKNALETQQSVKGTTKFPQTIYKINGP